MKLLWTAGALVLGIGLAAILGCSSARPVPPVPPLSGSSVALLAVGDIARCDSGADEEVAGVVETYSEALIVLLGDIAYESGTAGEFADCFDPAWGQFLGRLRPAPGNHEYNTPGAAGYYGYFGAAAGEPERGYYSFDYGDWHIVALNSNCSALAGGCGEASPQAAWLRSDLAATSAVCMLAFWHHPRFSSGAHGSSNETNVLWRVLVAAGADVAIAGHDHHYERFAPLNGAGQRDPGGMRSFIVGTGGAPPYPILVRVRGSERRQSPAAGVLKLDLFDGGYRWEFVGTAGTRFTDRGEARCSQ